MSVSNTNQEIPRFNGIASMRSFVQSLRCQGKTIGLVPTMGALHEGHLSLVCRCKSRCDVTIVSIYVNPTQFAPTEDLGKYPRTIERDLQLLRGIADAVFMPDDEMMYPTTYSTWVAPPIISNTLEGEFRKDHFRGVTTIVLKLFNIVAPDRAFFGQKDYQQLQVINAMVADLNVPVEVEGCPIVRDADGLALSSRNVFLSVEQRQRALALTRSLSAARESIRAGESDGHALVAELKQNLIDGGVSDLDYAVVVDPETLQPLESIRLPAVLLVAAYIDQIRLIDNCVIE